MPSFLRRPVFRAGFQGFALGYGYGILQGFQGFAWGYGDGILQKKPTKSNKKKNVVLKLREKDDTNYKFVSEEELEET